jgi:hypothetical protein
VRWRSNARAEPTRSQAAGPPDFAVHPDWNVGIVFTLPLTQFPGMASALILLKKPTLARLML